MKEEGRQWGNQIGSGAVFKVHAALILKNGKRCTSQIPYAEI